jgi:uncharacterized OB-fold protein
LNREESIYKIIGNGHFSATYCPKCRRYLWPLNFFCNICLNKTRYRKINNKGILLEKSYSHFETKKGSFGIGEFGEIRIIGTIDENAEVNDKIKISSMKVSNSRLDMKFKKIT